ncbi:MAG: VTT domain-containing protein, partial [Phycisphaerae bacterium]|nr:VTT domain-containing protein [Phycisphaerae bacterium]
AMTAFALCGTRPLSLVGGFAFGVYTGSIAAMAAMTVAAALAYWMVRRTSGDRVPRLIAEQPKWKAVYDALIGGSTAKTLLIVGLIRLSSSPFAITNLVLGSTRVHPAIFISGTVIGFAPWTIATVVMGAKLSNWNDPDTSSKWFKVAFIVVTLIVLSIIGTIANHAVQKVTQQEAK